METFEKVTMFFVGAFGTTKVECRSLIIEEKPYAQFMKATHIKFVEKGKRKAKGIVQTSSMGLVVAVGFDFPDPSMFEPSDSEGMSTTRFSCFSPEWNQVHAEFIASIKESGATVIYEAAK